MLSETVYFFQPPVPGSHHRIFYLTRLDLDKRYEWKLSTFGLS